MKKKKENRGGKRIGAGRKKKAPTTTISFRVVIEDVEPVKEAVRQYLNSKQFLKRTISKLNNNDKKH